MKFFKYFFACAATIVHRNHFLCLYQQNKSSKSKVKFGQASSCCKRVLEAARLTYAAKTKESITSQNLASRDFVELLLVFSTKANLLTSSIQWPRGFVFYIFCVFVIPDDVICNIAIYADDTTLYSKCNQASDLW